MYLYLMTVTVCGDRIHAVRDGRARRAHRPSRHDEPGWTCRDRMNAVTTNERLHAKERHRHEEGVLLVQAPDAVPARVLREEQDEDVKRRRRQKRHAAGPAEE